MGQKRRSVVAPMTSGPPLLTDILRARRHVANVPLSTVLLLLKTDREWSIWNHVNRPELGSCGPRCGAARRPAGDGKSGRTPSSVRATDRSRTACWSWQPWSGQGRRKRPDGGTAGTAFELHLAVRPRTEVVDRDWQAWSFLAIEGTFALIAGVSKTYMNEPRGLA